jgi:hypothetical protein
VLNQTPQDKFRVAAIIAHSGFLDRYTPAEESLALGKLLADLGLLETDPAESHPDPMRIEVKSPLHTHEYEHLAI